MSMSMFDLNFVKGVFKTSAHLPDLVTRRAASVSSSSSIVFDCSSALPLHPEFGNTSNPSDWRLEVPHRPYRVPTIKVSLPDFQHLIDTASFEFNASTSTFERNDLLERF